MLISAMPSLGDKVTCISLQIDSNVGFRTLRMDVDNFSGYSGSKPEVYYRFRKFCKWNCSELGQYKETWYKQKFRGITQFQSLKRNKLANSYDLAGDIELNPGPRSQCRLCNEQLNLDDKNRFNPLAKGGETKSPSTSTIKNCFVSVLKFLSININSIRGKKFELLAYLDFHQPQIVAIQET